MVYKGKSHLEMDDLGVPPHLWKHPNMSSVHQVIVLPNSEMKSVVQDLMRHNNDSFVDIYTFINHQLSKLIPTKIPWNVTSFRGEIPWNRRVADVVHPKFHGKLCQRGISWKGAIKSMEFRHVLNFKKKNGPTMSNLIYLYQEKCWVKPRWTNMIFNQQRYRD